MFGVAAGEGMLVGFFFGIKRSLVEFSYQLPVLYHQVVERLLVFLSNHTNRHHHHLVICNLVIYIYYDYLNVFGGNKRWVVIFVFV